MRLSKLGNEAYERDLKNLVIYLHSYEQVKKEVAERIARIK